jgi:ankyrin repeat protein
MNQQDQQGEHPLFAITKFLDPKIARLLIEKGSDINLRNHKGHNVLCQVLGRLRHPQENEIKRILEYLDMLLENGANVNSADDCTCNCNPDGCLPISGLSLKVQCPFERFNNPCWIFEWLCILVDHEKLVEAKAHALSILRQVKFDEKGLVHTCCYLGNASNGLVPEDEFWETSRLIEVDKLNDEMTIWEARGFNEIVAELMLRFKNLSIDFKESTCSSPKEHQAENIFPGQIPKVRSTVHYFPPVAVYLILRS